MMKKYINQHKKIIFFILESLKPFRSYIIGHLVIIVFTAVNISLMPLVSKILLNKIIASQDLDIFHEARLIIIILIFSIIMPSIFTRISDHIWANFLPKLRHHITHNSLSKLLNQSHNFFQNHFSGSIVNKVRDLFNSTPKIIEISLYCFFQGFLAVFIAFFTMSSINFFFAFALLTWIAIIIPLAYKSAILTNRISMNVSSQQGKIMGNIVDIFANIQNIKLFSNAKHEINRADQLQEKYTKLYLKRGLYLNKFYTALSLISSLYFVLCFIVLVSLFSHHKVTIGDFVLILGINNFLHNIIQDFMRQIRNFLEEISVIKGALEEVDKEIKIKNYPTKLQISKGEIVFENVKFSYHHSNPLFSDKSITIKAGQKVGLVGHSGSGKSTFINLLLRFYEVHEGRILIDDQDISMVSQDSLHEAIGVIPQEAILFHRNIIENISYGNKETLSSRELLQKVIDCSKKASAEKFIMKMPDNYYSQVGERGVKLSGGQRQRISIARAFFKNAPILILDEATSQLDSVTENIIQESLKNLMKNKTTLVIAHRLSTLQMMDRIIVFNKGKIVEDGTHDELIKMNGYYNQLWSAQSGGILTYQIGNATAQQMFSSNK